MLQRVIRNAAPVVGFVFLGLALASIHGMLKEYHYEDLRRTFATFPAWRLGTAVLLTGLSYFILTLYDMLAFRYLRQPMPYRKLALASFVGYSLSNNVGYSFLSGGAIRYRLYSNWGVNTIDIAKLITFCTATGWLGFAALGGVACLMEPKGLTASLPIPEQTLLPLGILLLGLVATYVAISLLRRNPLRLKTWEFSPPGIIGAAQVALGFVDMAVAGAVLYALMSFDTPFSFPAFAGLFILSLLAAVISQAPGGLGVFETMMILLLSPRLSIERVLGALLMFRVIYYLVPLFFAALIMAGYEARRRGAELQQLTGTLGAFRPVIPDVMAFLTLICGALLLFSGATPPAHGRMALLRDLLPLPVIELSHFLASLAGCGIILLARALQRRIDAAYWLMLLLLAAGIVLSLAKGIDYEEAIVLAAMLAALAPCHKEFHRRASILSPRFTPEWIAAVVMVVTATVWLGAFAHKHIEYSHDLWWRFTFDGSAPRFLRASVGVAALALVFAAFRLLRPVHRLALPPGPDEAAVVEAIVEDSKRTTSRLALIGDKQFLIDESRSAFIMYGVADRCWVAMGDPVGPEPEWADLIWSFCDRARRPGGWPVFYQVRPERLHLYSDVGLSLFKFGEEARVDLTSFLLEGKSNKTARNILSKLEREGCSFEVVPRESVPELLPALKTVSDQWLFQKNTREKGFSLGFFAEEYLSRFPHAIIRREGRIVAFANILEGARKQELSIDLMRYAADAPDAAMDFLLFHLLQWGASQGYRSFNFGMAPLAGIQAGVSAPLWHRMAALVYQHSEHFYNFQGLRHYKDKFHPVWEPRYIASPGGLVFPRALAGIARLVNRGILGTVVK